MCGEFLLNGSGLGQAEVVDRQGEIERRSAVRFALNADFATLGVG